VCIEQGRMYVNSAPYQRPDPSVVCRAGPRVNNVRRRGQWIAALIVCRYGSYVPVQRSHFALMAARVR